MSETDWELLARYSETNAEDAFADIVHRYVDLVHSAALRQVRSPHLAEEVAQSTFLKLAQHARQLAPGTIVPAWLYQVARREAIGVVRREAGRRLREQIATDMNAINATATDWAHIECLLDEAMEALEETDRTAVLLRYFENKSLREVGHALGTSDDAAQKRVTRAIDRLRDFFSRRHVSIGTSGLALAISANAVQTAPIGLATSISTTAGSMVAAGITATATKAIAMTATQKILIAATITAAIGSGIHGVRQASILRTQVHALREEQGQLTAKIDQLERERDDAVSRQQVLDADSQAFRRLQAEVPKLRGELALLRTSEKQAAEGRKTSTTASDPGVQQFLALKAMGAEIQRYLDQMPGMKIPELKFLDDEDWLGTVKTAKFDTDADIRQTLSNLRSRAKNRVPMGGALNAYIRANDGQLPTHMSHLKPYIKAALEEAKVAADEPTIDAVLERYTLLRTGPVNELPPGAWIVAETAPVDKDYDSRAKYGNGTSTIIGTGLHSAGDPDDKSY